MGWLQMLKKLRKNLLIKILSLLIAFIIWAIVNNNINPIVNDFVNVQVEIINEDVLDALDKTYTIPGKRSCKVNYKVSAEQKAQVRQSDFRAYIDLNDISKGTELPIYCVPSTDVSKYITNVSYEPKSIKVTLEDVISNGVPIKYRLHGEIDVNHTLGAVEFSPNTIHVSGRDAIVSKISHVSVDIMTSPNTELYEGNSKIRVIDKDGKEMPLDGLELSATEVSYKVYLFTKANVSLNCNIRGNVKSGYSYDGMEIEPKSLMVEGPKELIENLYSINLPDIDITDLTATTDTRFKVKDILPESIKCKTIDEINVRIKINDNSLGPQ